MGNSFFHFQQFSIFSQEKGLKVNSDACLLGAIAQHPNPITCLDIGTGTGVIALFIAQRFEQTTVSAIEIEETVYQQALHNIQSSVFKNRIDAVHADALDFPFEKTFDLIVCNPPYFKNHLEKVDSEKNRAIHNKTLNSLELIKRMEEILSPNGLFWLIYPPHEADNFKKLALNSGLHLQKEIHIFNKPSKHYRTILCLGRQAMMELKTQTFRLLQEDGNKTEEFRLLMSGFYLENTEKYKRNSEQKD